MAETYAVQLERVQAAIKAIEEGAQDYTVNGRRVTRGDLKTLYDREAYLRTKVDEENYGSEALAGW